MLKKFLILFLGNIKLFFIKLSHFSGFHYNLYNNVSLSSSIELSGKGKISFGKKFILHKNSRISVSGGNIEIGNCCGINSNCYIVSHRKIKIGNNVVIGPNVVIVDHDHNFTKNGVEHKNYNCANIAILDGAWIGANSVILKGTKIGRNCVIGAGSIINFDVPDNTVLIQKRENKYIEIE